MRLSQRISPALRGRGDTALRLTFPSTRTPTRAVSVYDSTSCQGLSGWLVFGGTSVAAPSLAGIVNLSGHFYINSTAELAKIYGNYTNTSDFRDIISGTAGSFSRKLNTILQLVSGVIRVQTGSKY